MCVSLLILCGDFVGCFELCEQRPPLFANNLDVLLLTERLDRFYVGCLDDLIFSLFSIMMLSVITLFYCYVVQVFNT